MIQNKKRVPASGIIILLLVLANVVAIKEGYVSNEKWYCVLVLTVPLLLLAIVNILHLTETTRVSESANKIK